MATVADIEPASLTITPGTTEQFTLTIRNEGEDVETYRLSAVGAAAEHIDIEPDTLLLPPGETATATATLRLEAAGNLAAGELAVRVEVVSTDRPDDVLVLGAIARIQSSGGVDGDVDAVLSPPAVEGRRSASTRVEVANIGNAQVNADIAVSAANLEFAADRQSVALAPRSSDGVGLSVKARGLLWRGDPVYHDFAVTVAPGGQPARTLEGTFRQLPLLPGWTFIAAIVGAAVIGLGVFIGLAVLLWNGLTGIAGPVAATEAATETPTPTPTAEPVAIVTELTAPADPDPAGGSVVATVAIDVAEAPQDALVAVAVTWPDRIALASDSCLGWLDASTDDLLDPDRPGLVRPGDQCLIDPGTLRAQADLEFTGPREGFSETVSAKATRLVSVEDGSVAEVGPGVRRSSDEELVLTLDPAAFWLQVEQYRPEPDSSTRLFVMAVHRTLDANSEDAQLALRISTPDFADQPNLYGAYLVGGAGACISVPEEDVCVVDFPVDVAPFNQGSGRWVHGALETQWVFVPIRVPTDESAAGIVSIEAVGLTEGDEVLGANATAGLVPPASGPLVLGSDAFPVDVRFRPSSAAGGDEVQATVALTAGIFDDRSAAEDGSRLIRVEFDWWNQINLVDEPVGCAEYDARNRICTLEEPAAGDELPEIVLTFTVDDDATFDGTDHADLLAKARVLTYPPDDEDDLTGGDDVPGGWPIRWDATQIQPLDFEFG